MVLKIPRIKIFKNQDPTQIEKLYADWIDKRIEILEKPMKEMSETERVDLLGIPSQLQLQWEQGLQAFVLYVNYNAHPLENNVS